MGRLVVSEVIVVGAGPAGCAATARLLEQGRSVTLIEAGPGPPYPPPVASLDTLAAVAAPGWDWADVVAPRRPSGSDSESAPRWPARYSTGRGVGGGAAVNSLVLTMGDRRHYDRWAAETGHDRWRWSNLEPAYRALVERLAPTVVTPGPFGSAVAAAATADGLLGDPAGERPRGSLPIDASGIRWASVAASATARVPLLSRLVPGADERGRAPGLTLRPDTEVRRPRVVRGRVQGVELADGSVVEAATVVLCAGALRTPMLLAAAADPARDGGPGPTWPVVDHPSFVFTATLRPGARLGLRPRPPVSVVIRDRLDGVAALLHVLDHVGAVEGRDHGAVVVSLSEVRSVGRLTLGPAGPVVAPGWLDDDDDARALARVVRRVGRWLTDPAVVEVAEAVHLDDRGTPAAALGRWSDDELTTWLRDRPGPVRHPCATLSPMAAARSAAGLPGSGSGRGPRPGGDGVALPEGLVVADGAGLPWVPAANPQLPIMVAARSAVERLG